MFLTYGEQFKTYLKALPFLYLRFLNGGNAMKNYSDGLIAQLFVSRRSETPELILSNHSAIANIMTKS